MNLAADVVRDQWVVLGAGFGKHAVKQPHAGTNKGMLWSTAVGGSAGLTALLPISGPDKRTAGYSSFELLVSASRQIGPRFGEVFSCGLHDALEFCSDSQAVNR